MPRPSGKFEVMDGHGLVAESNELYLKSPESAVVHGFKLRDILPSEARFLHPDYIEPYAEDRYWLAWLHDGLGLHTSPGIVSARPSSDFLSMRRAAWRHHAFSPSCVHSGPKYPPLSRPLT